jgi:hypothetical protein
MKKLFFTLMICTAVSLNAQTGKGAEPSPELRKHEIPSQVLDHFTREFPAAEPRWSRDGENYKAVFVNVETRLPEAVIYDKKGEVIRREGHHDLPSKTDSLEVEKH